MAERTCLDCGIPVTLSGRTWPKRCPGHAEEHRIKENRTRARAWQAENPERYREVQQRNRESNREAAAERSREWYRENRDFALARQRAYRQANPSDPEKDRWYQIRSKYGLTQEEYEKLLCDQGGVCANPACHTPDNNGRTLHVDHDHETGRVRGLLCFSCNVVLGKVRDDPATLRGLIAYLERGME